MPWVKMASLCSGPNVGLRPLTERPGISEIGKRGDMHIGVLDFYFKWPQHSINDLIGGVKWPHLTMDLLGLMP